MSSGFLCALHAPLNSPYLEWIRLEPPVSQELHGLLSWRADAGAAPIGLSYKILVGARWWEVW